MRNFELPYIPERSVKPRENGVTMMMDKGLSLREAENIFEASGHLTDIVKFGFGTAFAQLRGTFKVLVVTIVLFDFLRYLI